MKVIDLYNKIANGEEVPRKIKYCGIIYTYKNGDYYGGDSDEYYTDALLLPQSINPMNFLNSEIETIEDTPKEDKKIETIKEEGWELHMSIVKDKINEIIDKINGE